MDVVMVHVVISQASTSFNNQNWYNSDLRKALREHNLQDRVKWVSQIVNDVGLCWSPGCNCGAQQALLAEDTAQNYDFHHTILHNVRYAQATSLLPAAHHGHWQQGQGRPPHGETPHDNFAEKSSHLSLVVDLGFGFNNLRICHDLLPRLGQGKSKAELGIFVKFRAL
ncbi:hypothetical protein B0T21DRAFT_353201 [Apiosordaria backusii]|uniref:Uncharacterized protein n=1 Tax=Apiosordaria backusii TaxID=314023 RepID=A0AA39ZV16_9PEZI|nr:hypothetical protein B0T21DRAFT_353201 [Apiosordaria backusii]